MERISLQNDELEGANNVYLFDSGAQIVLVDTGDHTRESTLTAALEKQGVTMANVDEIFLTHWHPDHTGLVRTLHERSGATVRIHRRDAPLISSDANAWETFLEEQQSALESWGVPASKRQQFVAYREQQERDERLSLSSVVPFEDGDTFPIGDRMLEVCHTPGHTAGSVCFELDAGEDDTSTQDVITGDTLLPTYTPNIGGSDVRVSRPLDKYLASLGTFIDGEYDCAWPGHRDPITEPTKRAREIIAHHEQRASRIVELLDRDGPADVWTVCSSLFGELERFHILVGAGEAYAHLEHLDRQGIVERAGNTYKIDETARIDIDRKTDRWPLTVFDSRLGES